MAEFTFNYDNLFAGKIQPVVTGVETITGGNFTRGTVLGMVTASELCTIVNSANADGSQTFYAVLAEDCDASAGDVDAVVYYTGEFNKNALTFGGTDTSDTHRVAARKVGAFFKNAVSA